MSACPAVKIDGCFVADNTYSSDGKVWTVTNLIARAKHLEPFDLPLAAIYLGANVWAAESSPYGMAFHMRRALDVNTDYPIIQGLQARLLYKDIKYLPQMPDETERRYLFVAIDRATRWAYMSIYADQDFLIKLNNACPTTIGKLLTDNSGQFTDRFTCKKRLGNRRPDSQRQARFLHAMPATGDRISADPTTSSADKRRG